MTDFSFLSDTDEAAVDQILAEAMDHCVLQQVAAINCSSFSHSVLPSHLESRFQRLKTFPTSSSKPIYGDSSEVPKAEKNNLEGKSRIGYVSSPSDSSEVPKNEKDNLEGKSRIGYVPTPSDSSEVPKNEKNNLEGKSRIGYVSSPSDFSNSSSGCLDSPKFRAKEGVGKGKEGKSLSGSFSSSRKMAKTGCFWCSPKRVSRKKSDTRKGVGELGVDWGKHDELLTDLKSFSSKEQKKMMKIARKEEEKISEEAEKIVKWAKQTSARLDFSLTDDDDLSDDNNRHDFFRH